MSAVHSGLRDRRAIRRKWLRFRLGNRCSFRLSYGAVRQQDSALRSAGKSRAHAVHQTAARGALAHDGSRRIVSPRQRGLRPTAAIVFDLERGHLNGGLTLSCTGAAARNREPVTIFFKLYREPVATPY
jgi:hypothetical protein